MRVSKILHHNHNGVGMQSISNICLAGRIFGMAGEMCQHLFISRYK